MTSVEGAQMHRCLELEPDPRAASTARRWVRGLLHEVGRDELTETTELATSELVTNAILHARTDISVVVDIDGVDVVVEIRDGSALLPTPAEADGDAAGDLDLDTVPSVGNGLLILGAVTRCWGVRQEPGDGKAVWFVPAPDSGEALEPQTSGPSDRADLQDAVTVALVDAPVLPLWQETSRCRDLARELSLVALGEDDPTLRDVAHSFAEHLVLDDAGWSDLHDAHAAGRPSVSLRLQVERSQATRAVAFGALLDRLDALSRAERLLTVPASDDGCAVRRWVLCEIERQCAGAPPQPWPPRQP